MKGIINLRLRLLHPRTAPFIPHPSSLIPLSPSSLILFAYCVCLFFQGIESRSLWASHEARAAQDAQSILDDGDWLLPHLLDGQAEMQKPPAFYWLVAAVGACRGGIDSWAVRLPAILAGIITVLLVNSHLRRRGRPVAGFIAAAMLASAVHFTGTARIGRIDVPLACVVCAMMMVSSDALAEREGSRFANASLLTVGLLGGLALLLKGPIGLVLPAVALLVFCLIERVPSRTIAKTAAIVGAIAVAIASPWYAYAILATDGEFFRVFILYHHFNRAFGGAETLAGHPFWFYLPRFAADFLPWTPLLLVALLRRRWRGDADARFGLVWFAVMLLVLSLSRFKRADYLLPAYAGAAIFLGCAVEGWYLARTATTRRRLAVAFLATLTLMPAFWLGFDRVVTAKEESAHNTLPFAQEIRQATPGEVTLFRVESHLLAYQLGRPVHTLVEWADLNAELRQPGPHFVVTRAEFLDEVRLHSAVAPAVIAWSNPKLQRPLILLRFDPPCPTPPRD